MYLLGQLQMSFTDFKKAPPLQRSNHSELCRYGSIVHLNRGFDEEIANLLNEIECEVNSGDNKAAEFSLDTLARILPSVGSRQIKEKMEWQLLWVMRTAENKSDRSIASKISVILEDLGISNELSEEVWDSTSSEEALVSMIKGSPTFRQKILEGEELIFILNRGLYSCIDHRLFLRLLRLAIRFAKSKSCKNRFIDLSTLAIEEPPSQSELKEYSKILHTLAHEGIIADPVAERVQKCLSMFDSADSSTKKSIILMLSEFCKVTDSDIPSGFLKIMLNNGSDASISLYTIRMAKESIERGHNLDDVDDISKAAYATSEDMPYEVKAEAFELLSVIFRLSAFEDSRKLEGFAICA